MCSTKYSIHTETHTQVTRANPATSWNPGTWKRACQWVWLQAETPPSALLLPLRKGHHWGAGGGKKQITLLLGLTFVLRWAVVGESVFVYIPVPGNLVATTRSWVDFSVEIDKMLYRLSKRVSREFIDEADLYLTVRIGSNREISQISFVINQVQINRKGEFKWIYVFYVLLLCEY